MTRPVDRPRTTLTAPTAPAHRRCASALLAVCGLVAGSAAGVPAVVGAPSASAASAATSREVMPAATLTQLTVLGVERAVDDLTGAVHFHPGASVAAGVAGRLKAPVVLVPSSGALPYADRYQALTAGQTVVVGSTSTVSDDVTRALGTDVRLGGADRYGTSLEVARWAVQQGVSANEVAVASSVGGRNADALAASVLGGITLLVPTQSWGKDVHSFLLGSGTTSVLTIGGSTPSR